MLRTLARLWVAFAALVAGGIVYASAIGLMADIRRPVRIDPEGWLSLAIVWGSAWWAWGWLKRTEPPPLPYQRESPSDRSKGPYTLRDRQG